MGSTFVTFSRVRAGYAGPFMKEDCPVYKATLKRGRVSMTKVKFGFPYSA